MPVFDHIESLLKENHDCVIVPGLGGFVVNPKHASIKLPQHRFNPPGKEIRFNEQLSKNDGLLGYFVAEQHAVTYAEGIALIESEVRTLKIDLKKGESVTCGNLGSFKINATGKLVFSRNEAFRFSKDDFGLLSFTALPITKENATQKVERGIKEAKVVPVSGRRNVQDWKMVAAIPLFIAIGAFATWTLSNFGILDQHTEHAKLEPSTEIRQPSVKDDLTDDALSLTPDPIVLEDLKKDIDPDADPVNGDPVEDADPADADQVDEVPTDPSNGLPDGTTGPLTTGPLTTELIGHAEENPGNLDQSVQTNFRFHVIGGCFSVYENAERMVRNLKAEGYKASLLGKNNKGLHRVSIQGYASRMEAKAGLQAIKANNHSGWVLAQ